MVFFVCMQEKASPIVLGRCMCLGHCPFLGLCRPLFFSPTLLPVFIPLWMKGGSHCSVLVCLNRQSHHDSQEPGLRQPQRHLGQTRKGSGEPTMRWRMNMFFVFFKCICFIYWSHINLLTKGNVPKFAERLIFITSNSSVHPRVNKNNKECALVRTISCPALRPGLQARSVTLALCHLGADCGHWVSAGIRPSGRHCCDCCHSPACCHCSCSRPACAKTTKLYLGCLCNIPPQLSVLLTVCGKKNRNKLSPLKGQSWGVAADAEGKKEIVIVSK